MIFLTTHAGSKRQSIPDFTLIKINRDGGVEILEVWMPNIRKKHNKRRVFSRNGLFLDYLFAENRILELTLVIRSMKREEEKWWPHVGTSSYQNYANSAFLLLYSSIPILPFLIYPTILCKFFTLAKKFAEVRIIVVFLFVFFFFLIFVCIKSHPSSDSGPSKENFMKRVQIQDDEEAKCQR